MSIEQKTADTLLENAIGVIEIGEEAYAIEPPTLATLAMASAVIAQLPQPEGEAKCALDISDWMITHAIECAEPIARCAAILILGARRIKEQRMRNLPIEVPVRKWSWLKMRKIETIEMAKIQRLELDWLSETLEQEFTPKRMADFLSGILHQHSDLSDFFVLTTSLTAQSLTKPTKEVENQTASGR